MQTYKIIGADGKEYGPVSGDQIRQWISEGRVNEQTRVLSEGAQDWVPLSNLPEFGSPSRSPAFGAPPPAPSLSMPAGGSSKPPGEIRVFGILNTVFGAFGLLCAPVGFAMLPLTTQQLGNQPLMTQWLMISSFFSFFGAAVMLVSGVGLCKYKSWARKLAVYYAVFASVMNLVGTFVVLGSFGSNTGLAGAQRVGGIIGSIFSVVLGLTYNVLLIYFLSRRTVRQALGETV